LVLLTAKDIDGTVIRAMLDTAQIILLSMVVILTVLLLALGTQVFFILRDFRKTLKKADKVLDNTGTITQIVSTPLSAFSNVGAGIKTGKALIHFLKKTVGKMSKEEE